MAGTVACASRAQEADRAQRDLSKEGGGGAKMKANVAAQRDFQAGRQVNGSNGRARSKPAQCCCCRGD